MPSLTLALSLFLLLSLSRPLSLLRALCRCGDGWVEDGRSGRVVTACIGCARLMRRYGTHAQGERPRLLAMRGVNTDSGRAVAEVSRETTEGKQRHEWEWRTDESSGLVRRGCSSEEPAAAS